VDARIVVRRHVVPVHVIEGEHRVLVRVNLAATATAHISPDAAARFLDDILQRRGHGSSSRTSILSASAPRALPDTDTGPAWTPTLMTAAHRPECWPADLADGFERNDVVPSHKL
jgi:hypothetical protein